MLSDRQCELLTAYVDGELDASERDAVDRLLTSMPEAREFLVRLEADSKELHDLPTHKAPETLAETVMGTVWDTGPRRRPDPPPPVAPQPKKPPRLLGLTLAAVVLLSVAIGTFFLAGLLFDDQQEKMADPGHGPKLDPFMGELLTTAAGKFGDDIVDSELGVRLSVTDFHEEPVQKRLTAELRKGLSFWLDFPAISNRLGVERLSLAFKSAGIAVLVDPAAQASLTKKQQKLRYALYAENVAHDEVTAILHHIHKAELGTPAARTFDQLVLTSINADKRAVLAKAMRVDPKHIDPGFKVPDLPAMIELPKGAPAKIANQAKVPERLALLVALEGDGRAVDSPQFRQFWDARQGFLPGTVQIVLVIREQST